jgi:uncharacterized protein YdeI (YjbR/CyaY-like superfamily)
MKKVLSAHKHHPGVDAYLRDGCGRCALYRTLECKVHRWNQVLTQLRLTILECGLEEDLKWSVPCYTQDGKNIAISAAFKDYCVISFLKGCLIDDRHNLLTQAGPNSRIGRVIRISSTSEVGNYSEAIRDYLRQAIEIERLGLKPPLAVNESAVYPEELLARFADLPPLQLAFESLTPGRQRGYLIFFTGAKQSKTRAARIEKCIPAILQGIGFHEQYKS